MLIDDTPEDKEIWDYVYDTLRFHPSYEDKGHSFRVQLPFQIPERHAVYAIEQMTEAQCDLLRERMRECFIRITEPGQKIYALDWQHSSFLYDPRNPDEQESIHVQNARYPNGYQAYFPEYYPDGDYYFFIDAQRRFGYLGHPWRQEIWVYGSALMQEVEAISHELGWSRLL